MCKLFIVVVCFAVAKSKTINKISDPVSATDSFNIEKRSIDDPLVEKVHEDLGHERISLALNAEDLEDANDIHQLEKREILLLEGIYGTDESGSLFKRSIRSPVTKIRSIILPASERISKRSLNQQYVDVEETTRRDMSPKFGLRKKRNSPNRIYRRFVQDRFTGGIVIDPWMGRL